MAFPWYHHPSDWHLRSNTRDYFASYGTLGNLIANDGEEAGQVTMQHAMPSSDINQLFATSPTMPLTPPNQVADLCVLPTGTIREFRERLRVFLRSFTMTRSHVQSKRYKSHLVEAKQYLSKLEGDGQLDMKMQDLPPYMQRSFISFTDIANEFASYEVSSELLLGSCLSSHQSHDTTTLFYSSGEKMQTLCIDSVEAGGENDDLQATPQHRLDVGDKIHQISSVAFSDSEWCCVRDAEHKLTFLKATTGQDSTWKDVSENQWEKELSDIAFSPFIAGECSVTTLNGSVVMCDLNDSSRTINILEKLEPRFDLYEHWWRCHYAAHPRQLVVTDGTGVAIYDVRHKQAVSEGLFVLPNPQLKIEERIQVSARHPDNDFYHVIATDAAIFVVDQRLPNKPVLNWCHGLQSAPRYLSIVANSPATFHSPNQTVALLASRDTAEVHCYPFSVAMDSLPPAWMDAPWKLSRVNDCLLYGIRPSTTQALVLEQRLEAPLLGIAASYRNNVFNTFQLTTQGEVFYQQYKPTGERFQDKTLAAGPGSKNTNVSNWCKKKWLRWMTTVNEQSDEKYLRHTDYMAMQQHVGKDCAIVNSQYLTMGLTYAAYPHILCQLCMGQMQQRLLQQPPTIPDEEHMESVCHACGLTLRHASQLKQAASSGGIVAHEELSDDVLNRVPRLEAEEFTDADSQILTALWDDDEPDLTELLQQREKEYKDYKKRRKQNSGVEVVPAREEMGVEVGPNEGHMEVGDDSNTIEESPRAPSPARSCISLFDSADEDWRSSQGQSTSGMICSQNRTPKSAASPMDSPSPSREGKIMSPQRSRHSSTSSVGSFLSSFQSFSPGFLTTPTRQGKRRLTSPAQSQSGTQGLFKLPQVIPRYQQNPSPSQSHSSHLRSPHRSSPPQSPSRILFTQPSPSCDRTKTRHQSQPLVPTPSSPYSSARVISSQPTERTLETFDIFGSPTARHWKPGQHPSSPGALLKSDIFSSKSSSPRKKASANKSYTMGF